MLSVTLSGKSVQTGLKPRSDIHTNAGHRRNNGTEQLFCRAAIKSIVLSLLGTP